MVWFARMLDKIRLHAEGRLSGAYVPFLGKGFDGRCLRYLRVDYDALVARTLAGGNDEELLAWCFETGRRLTAEDIEVWNGFLSKRGWRDGEAVTANLEESKRADGLGDRADIVTFFDYDGVDEGSA
jgi:gluconokinase